jgi:hypothetical protein
MDVGYKDFDGKRYVFVQHNDRPVFLRNVAFISNPSRTKLLVVHCTGSAPHKDWEPPKGLCEWDDFADCVSNGKISRSKYVHCLRAGMTREVSEEAKVYADELRNVKILPYAFFGTCDVQNVTYMYQFWSATITERTLQKAKQRHYEVLTNPNLVPDDSKETDGVDWYDSRHMNLKHGPPEKMIRLYLRLLNKHSTNV